MGRQQQRSGKLVGKFRNRGARSEVERNQQALWTLLAKEQQQIAGGMDRTIAAAEEGAPRSPQCNEVAIEVIDRGRIAALLSDVVLSKMVGQRQPRLDLGKAGIAAVVPLHGGAAAVAAHFDAGQILLERIPDAVRRYRYLRHADLVAEIDGGVPRNVSRRRAAIRACLRPTRPAMRGRSWLPKTQFGQPPSGRAASYSWINLPIVPACHVVLSKEKLNGRWTPRRSRP